MNDQLLRARNATIGELERFLWVNRDKDGASCRSSRVRNAPLATVGARKAACREGPLRD
jgi:hypothetical protein